MPLPPQAANARSVLEELRDLFDLYGLCLQTDAMHAVIAGVWSAVFLSVVGEAVKIARAMVCESCFGVCLLAISLPDVCRPQEPLLTL